MSINCMPDTLQMDSPPCRLKRWRISTTFTTIQGNTRWASLRNCLRNCMMPDVEIKVGRQIQETIQES